MKGELPFLKMRKLPAGFLFETRALRYIWDPLRDLAISKKGLYVRVAKHPPLNLNSGFIRKKDVEIGKALLALSIRKMIVFGNAGLHYDSNCFPLLKIIEVNLMPATRLQL